MDMRENNILSFESEIRLMELLGASPETIEELKEMAESYDDTTLGIGYPVFI